MTAVSVVSRASLPDRIVHSGDRERGHVARAADNPAADSTTDSRTFAHTFVALEDIETTLPGKPKLVPEWLIPPQELLHENRMCL